MSKALFIAAAVAAFCIAATPESKAFGPAARFRAQTAIPVVVFGDEARRTLGEFARANRLDAAALARRHAASGVIHCGNVRGAGQLTLADDVITTAAHVFYGRDGALRADGAHCLFTATVAGVAKTSPIDLSSIISGNRDPYANPAVHDWAVARLARPLKGAAPYAIGPAAAPAQRIEFVARGHQDWGGAKQMSIEACALHEALNAGAEGTREISFDCAAGLGASGGAVLDASGARLLGIFVGYRSVAPDQPLAFSAQHYNFAVTLEGAFRRAVETAAGGGAGASAERQ